MRSIFVFILCVLSAWVGVASNDLAVAKEALRDGLWEIARTHAAAADGDEAKIIILETYAHERNWRKILTTLDAMGNPSGEGIAYYRALALCSEGSYAAASNVLYSTQFRSPDYLSGVARLKAMVAMAAADLEGGLRILLASGCDDVETHLMTARLYSLLGRRAEAERQWQRVLAVTNASERAQLAGAMGLRDAKRLRTLSEKAESGSVRQSAALGLGMVLLSDSAQFSEAQRLICETVRQQPDLPHAYEAYGLLAEAAADRGEWALALKTWNDALTIWPAAARDAALRMGRGRALERLERLEEALADYRLAEKLVPDAGSGSRGAAALPCAYKADAVIRAGDVLGRLGRSDEAIAAYEAALADYPTMPEAARVRRSIGWRKREMDARALYRAGNYEAARKMFAALAAEDSARVETLRLCEALCAYGMGDDAHAEREVRHLAAHGKAGAIRAHATLWLAKYVYNRGIWREAEKLFSDYVDEAPKAPDAPDAIVWAARAALSDNAFDRVIAHVTQLVSSYPTAPQCGVGMLVQGEALIELARFTEAVVVLDRALLVAGLSARDRRRAKVLRADALFAMGADNPVRYEAALKAYGDIRSGEALTPAEELLVSFKMAKTLEKLKRMDEALDVYYARVVLAYRTGRLAGVAYDDAACALFAKAAFRLAEEYESRGRASAARQVLELVRKSDVPAVREAANRIRRIQERGVMP